MKGYLLRFVYITDQTKKKKKSLIAVLSAVEPVVYVSAQLQLGLPQDLPR